MKPDFIHRFRKEWDRRMFPAAAGVPVPILLLAIVLGVTVVSMTWLGLRATREWRRSARVVAEQRVDEVATLLAIALTRDMVGAQESILARADMDQLMIWPPHEIADIVSRAFARFPYPESFFLWRSDPTAGDSALLFNRSDRPPRWEDASPTTYYPVTIITGSRHVQQLAAMSRQYAPVGGEFALFETTIDSITYQVVARTAWREGLTEDVAAIFGFTVNVDALGQDYLDELIAQIGDIGGNIDADGVSLALTIMDDAGRVIAETRAPGKGGPMRERSIPMAFFDLSVVPAAGLEHMPLRYWTARISTVDNASFGAADEAAGRTMLLIVVAAGASALALSLALYSLRTNARLVQMQANFVATVSHELKTPLAGISLVGETLSKRRYGSEDDLAEYGTLISKEASRLRKLVDDVLSISRISDSQSLYVMTASNVRDLVCEAIGRLEPFINEAGFEVTSRMSEGLPGINCDREAMIQVFEILIDNAIKFSEIRREIDIRASERQGKVVVSVRDRGRGIPPEDAPYVFDRFFRGRNAGVQGSGLGLAIARKIVAEHGGDIEVESALDEGTTVTVTLPSGEGG